MPSVSRDTNGIAIKSLSYENITSTKLVELSDNFKDTFKNPSLTAFLAYTTPHFPKFP